MLGHGALTAALGHLGAVAFSGQTYRAIDLEALFGFHRTPPYPAPRPLYSLGASASGGRYTARGGPGSLYVAEDPATALAESWQVDLARLKPSGASAKPSAPTVVIAIHLQLDTILDVTDPGVQTALGTTTLELQAAWRHLQARGHAIPTQALSQAVFDSGRWQAIRYPSTKSAGKCLVIFSDRLAPPAFVEVYDPNGNLVERIP